MIDRPEIKPGDLVKMNPKTHAPLWVDRRGIGFYLKSEIFHGENWYWIYWFKVGEKYRYRHEDVFDIIKVS